MDSETARVEHLKLIQAIVARLGRNSFAIKSTAVAASAALVAFIASVGSPFAALGGLAILFLWILDARFLQQERSFRRLYNSVRKGPPREPGSDDYFAMKESLPDGRCDSILKVTVSQSLSLFYVPLVVLVGGSSGFAWW